MKSSKKFPYQIEVRLVKKSSRSRGKTTQSGGGFFDILKKGVNILTSDKAQNILKYAQKGLNYANKGQEFPSKYNGQTGQKGSYLKRKRKRRKRNRKNQAGARIFKLLYNVLKEI